MGETPTSKGKPRSERICLRRGEAEASNKGRDGWWSYRFLLQDGYTFDMRRLWEHIEWLHRAQMVGGMKMAKDIQVTGQRGWIARDIDDARNGMLDKGVEHDLLASRPWWVDHQPYAA